MHAPWHQVLAQMQPYVFKILTPNGSGTGFQIFTNSTLCGIATAYHVVEHAYEWNEPIKLLHLESGKVVLVKEVERVIYPDKTKDLACILFNKIDIPLKDQSPSLVPAVNYMKNGGEIGWCGFPAIAPDELCFFSGHVSCFIRANAFYLIDGVAINGVSGGPAFDDQGQIMGVVSAYIPNTATGQTLPGLCVVRSVAPYEETLKELRSLTEAAAQKEQKVEEIKEATLEAEKSATESE